MPRRGASVHIKNLSDGIRHEEIRRVFGKYGHLVDVTVPVNYHSGRSKGFAFVEFEDSRDADDAIYNLNQTRIWGREITVELTRGTRKTPSEMRTRDHGSRYESGSRSHGRSRSRSPRRSSRRDGGGYEEEDDSGKPRRRHDANNSPPRRRDDELAGRRHRRESRKSNSKSPTTTSPPAPIAELNGRRAMANGNARGRSLMDDANRYQADTRVQHQRSKHSYSRREVNNRSPISGSRSPVSIIRGHNSHQESPNSRGSMSPN